MIYFVRCADRVKIGFTGNVPKRLAQLQTSAPEKLDLLCVMPGDRHDEAAMHRRFAALRGIGEWFRADAEVLEFARWNKPLFDLWGVWALERPLERGWTPDRFSVRT